MINDRKMWSKMFISSNLSTISFNSVTSIIICISLQLASHIHLELRLTMSAALLPFLPHTSLHAQE